MEYEVVNQPVEINGKTYPVGSIVGEDAFKAPEMHTVDGQEIGWSETASLLDTGHIVIVNK